MSKTSKELLQEVHSILKMAREEGIPLITTHINLKLEEEELNNM